MTVSYLRDVVTSGDLQRTITDSESISTGAMQNIYMQTDVVCTPISGMQPTPPTLNKQDIPAINLYFGTKT